MLELDRWAVDCARSTPRSAVETPTGTISSTTVYQRVHNFCAVDMSSFYLDIIKDRQYTMPADSLGRRSAQSAMYLIADALVRWIAPVLSFTSDEIWQHLPGKRARTVFTETYSEALFELDGTSGRFSRADWSTVIEVRHGVSKALEALRADSIIGSSLDAAVVLYCTPGTRELLDRLGEELRFVLITSEVRVDGADTMPAEATRFSAGAEEVGIAAAAAAGDKCVRCWHRRPDTGSVAEHPQLCARCAGNVAAIDQAGDAEERQFA